MTVFSAGDKPTAAQLNDMQYQSVVKFADESLTTNTVLQADDELFIQVGANSRYRVEMLLIWNSPAAADLKGAWTVPAGHGGYYTITTQSIGAAADTVFTGALFWTTGFTTEGSASDKFVRVSGVLTTTNAGTLALTWAQQTSSGTTTVKANSLLEIRKIS